MKELLSEPKRVMKLIFATVILFQLINLCFGVYDLINDVDQSLRAKRYGKGQKMFNN